MPWLAVPLGMATGAVVGALGAGGAILTIPVLIYLLGMPAHAATTASLVIVGVGAGAGVLGHLRHGTVRALDAVVLAAVGVVGTWAGAWASSSVPERVLVVLLATLLAVVGALMIRRATGAEPDGAGEEVDRAAALPRGLAQLARVAGVGIGLGALTGFFGVGGGFAIVPALTLVLGYPVRTAVATSLLVIALNSATAFAARLAHGVELDWRIVGLFTAGTIAGSLLGGALGRRTSPARLGRAFAVLLFGIAAYMLGAAVLGHTGG